MPSRRRVHDVSDSEPDDGHENSAARVAESPVKKKTAKRARSADEDADEVSSTAAHKRSPNRCGDDREALAVLSSSSAQDSLMCFDDEYEEIERTPKSFTVTDVSKRPSRKTQNLMFAYLVDRSPSAYEDLQKHAGYILKRSVIDTLMRMRFNKFQTHHVVALTCCDKNTDNRSHREQAKVLNKHCVEILQTGKLTVDEARTLADVSDFKPESEQFSNVVAGLMTAADLIARSSRKLDPYEQTEVTLFSDLVFNRKLLVFGKMARVLAAVLPGANLTVVSNAEVIASDDYQHNVNFLKSIFGHVEVLSYEEAVQRTEQWTMAEQMPLKFTASIKLLEQEIPIEAYLACNEKNVSLLKTCLEKVSNSQPDSKTCFELPESALREEKQLVKLTDDGHYMKNDDGLLVTIDPERAAMAFKFGVTAVPTEKKLTEYFTPEPSHKGYVVRGWYPAHQFALYVSGGKGYRVFAGGSNCSLFDSLLVLCARKSYALLVDYTYLARFGTKPGVLIPHRKKRCFVFYTLVYEDNVNYLPRYDPITTLKPPVENIRKMCDVIAAAQLTHLVLKYDPQSQQVIEDCWSSELGERVCNFHEKFAEVTFRTARSALQDKIDDFKQSADGYVRRLPIKKKTDESEESNDCILFSVEPLDDDQIEIIKPNKFRSLFKK